MTILQDTVQLSNGIYHIQFSGPNGVDHGTIVIDGKRAHGGDTTYYYVAAFEVRNDGEIHARVKIARHPAGKQAASVFGPIAEARLELTGTATHDSFTLGGHLQGVPNARITLCGKRSSELDRL